MALNIADEYLMLKRKLETVTRLTTARVPDILPKRLTRSWKNRGEWASAEVLPHVQPQTPVTAFPFWEGGVSFYSNLTILYRRR